jgi:myo-inositol-1(or 4)-monophosphatase
MFDAFLELAIQAAYAAGRVIRESAQRPIDVHSKGPRDLLTDVDLAAERTILNAIRDRYPDHDVLTEESPPQERRSRYCWVVDPLDGTGNFTHRYPCFSTAIALTQYDEPIVGVVYDPIREHTFAAALGGGATLNGQPLHVSEVDALLDAFIGMDWTRDVQSRALNVRIIAQLTPQCNVLRICGSAALAICYVGAGWWDAYWHVGLQPWDAAAGALIVREAGGQVTDVSGQRWKLHTAPFLASNGRVHQQVCAQISKIA